MFYSFFNGIISFCTNFFIICHFEVLHYKAWHLAWKKIHQVEPVNNTVSIYLTSGVLGSTCFRIGLDAAELCSFKTWGSFRDYRAESSAHNTKRNNQTNVNPSYETRLLLAIVKLFCFIELLVLNLWDFGLIALDFKSEQFWLWQLIVEVYEHIELMQQFRWGWPHFVFLKLKNRCS